MQPVDGDNKTRSISDVLENSIVEDEPLMLKTGEVARIFRVTNRTVRGWVARNDIPYLQVGTHYRYSRAAIRDHLVKSGMTPEEASATIDATLAYK